MSSQRVSVVLPIYAEEPSLHTALNSLETQTIEPLEVIAVTESTTDETSRILDSASIPTLKIKYQGEGGISAALNAGIERASGEYIARMDADDIAMQNRLERQVAVLESNPQIGVLGSAYERIDKSGISQGVITPPLTHLGIRWRLLLTSCIPHPTAVIRRSVLEETGIRYRPEYNAAEDYDLWTRLATKTKLRNLDEPLIKYRIAGNRKSERDDTKQKNLAESIATRTVNRDLPDTDFSEKEIIAMQGMLYRGESERVDKRKVSGDCFELLRQFEREYSNSDIPKEIPRDLSVTLARSILRPPIQTDSLRKLVKLISVDPGYPFALALFLLERRTQFQPGSD